MIKARFVPKVRTGRIKRYLINFGWLANRFILVCQPTAAKIFPESRICRDKVSIAYAFFIKHKLNKSGLPDRGAYCLIRFGGE
jgi:hypothetical protein